MTVTTTPPQRTTIPAASPLTRDRGRDADAESAGWEKLTEAVREAGQYPTRAEAERVTCTVLSALGGHVTGDERVALAQSLPREAARLIASQIPTTHLLTAREFVDSVATRIDGATPATARWHVSSVLTVLATWAGAPLTTHLLTQLPPGYALLFGRADLAPTT
ncbi:DUF2267 domain-containing protein [Streptomyces durhamensis]|uniref:DUF2267 domain-containing protein n=1 Tax=Streptomyces durhamensis TaxID=68194 RepID=UPI0004CD5909|nr:DUF2267 domain-containing protein [Streptomyces durhamensis]